MREGILKQNKARTEKAKSYPPTKVRSFLHSHSKSHSSLSFSYQVHLQIYDEVCHDLPLFSFTTPAKYCYRAMASFARWVTTPEGEQPQTVPPDGMRLPVERDPAHPDAASLHQPEHSGSVPSTSAPSVRSSAASARTNGRKQRKKRTPPAPIPDLEKTIYSSTQPFNRPDYVDNMIRERVSMTGVVRPMEPESDMSMLHLDPEDVGLIKEDAVRRYLAGSASRPSCVRHSSDLLTSFALPNRGHHAAQVQEDVREGAAVARACVSPRLSRPAGSVLTPPVLRRPPEKVDAGGGDAHHQACAAAREAAEAGQQERQDGLGRVVEARPERRHRPRRRTGARDGLAGAARPGTGRAGEPASDRRRVEPAWREPASVESRRAQGHGALLSCTCAFPRD